MWAYLESNINARGKLNAVAEYPPESQGNQSLKFIYIKLVTIMIAPFIIAFLIFGIEYILLDETKLNYLVDWSGPIFQFTSIHTAYSQTHDSNILYFWVFWLFAIPVFCLLFVLAACGLTIRNVDLSRGQVTGCLSLVLLLLFSLFGHSNFYVLNAKYAIYSPSVGGIFAYAFAFEAICFLGITPILKLFSFLFADRR